MHSNKMGRIAAIVAGIVVIGAAATAKAELLAYEGFDYVAGQSFSGANGGYGFSGGWIVNANVVPNCITLAGSFTYTDSFGNSITSLGNRALISGDGSAAGDNLPGGYTGGTSASPYRRLSFSRGTDAVNTTTWASIIATRVGLPYAYTNASGNVTQYGRGVGALQFFYNASATSTTQGNEMVGVGRGSENNTSATFDPLHTMDTWAVLNRGNAAQQTVSEVGFAALPADFLLVRIDHAAGVGPHTNAASADTIRVWINPPNLAKEPALAKADIVFTPISVDPTNDRDYIFNIIRFFGGNFNTTVGYSSVQVDELRIGTEFLDVTLRAIPEPSIFALGVCGGLALLALGKPRK